MKCKSKLYYYVLMPLLCFVLVLPKFTILSYASTTSGSETTQYNYTTIYPNNQLNQNVIDKFNSMTFEEKARLLPFLSPIFLRSLGIYTSDAYSRINELYNESLASFKSDYPEASDLNDSDESYAIKKAYIYYVRESGRYFYYNDFDDYLAHNIQETGGQLVLSDTETIYNVYDDVIHNEQLENGVIKAHIMSYTEINSSNFSNLSAYTDFIRLCRLNEDKKYVFLNRNTGANVMHVIFADSPVNLYNDGSVLGNTLRLVKNDGTTSFTFKTYGQNNSGQTNFSQLYTNRKVGTAYVGTSSVLGQNGGLSTNNSYVITSPVSCYTLAPSGTDTWLYTSLAGWINSQGHYEPSYQIGDNYGTVPSAVVSSNDITTYYNNTYVDNSVHDSNNVYYPPNYNPSSNGYDTDTHTLKFDGVGSFLASIGELFGALINGIAEGIANIVNSLISIVNNLKLNLIQGPIFELLSAFMSWLPDEIVALLTALFSITIIFALIKLIKGFF